MAIIGSIDYDSPGAGFSHEDQITYKEGAGASCVQNFRLCGAAGSTSSGAFTATLNHTLEGKFSAVRFKLSNLGGAVYAVGAAKCAAVASYTSNGSGATPADITFDTSATGKASDTYTGVAGVATTVNVPARVGAGTGANAIPGECWSDWVPLNSIACTDVGNEDLTVVQSRVYVALASTFLFTGTSASNMGDYNTNTRRKLYGQFTAGDQVTAFPNITVQANIQWFPLTQVQALLYKTCTNHAFFGDSITKGQGSFDQNNGIWGWAQRGVQGLTDAGFGAHSLVNYAVAGQGSAATWATFLNVLDQGNVSTATMFPWSPNDGISAGATPWALDTFKYRVYAFIAACRRNGIRPILATIPPCSVITDVPGDLVRIAVNTEVRAICEGNGRNVVLCDFDLAVANTASPARFQSSPSLSVDQVHPNSAGHEVMKRVWQAAAKQAIFVA